MTRHTPGPWLMGHGNRIANDDASRPRRICNLARGNEDNKANARLITAAPDLLAACNEITSALRLRDGQFEYSQEKLGQAVLSVIAAIAKAEGK